jgi:hypothetical protein
MHTCMLYAAWFLMFKHWFCWKYQYQKRVLLRKYQEIQPTFLSNIGQYHAIYSLDIHVHEVYMMNDVRSGPSYQHFRPWSKQCNEAHIYTSTNVCTVPSPTIKDSILFQSLLLSFFPFFFSLVIFFSTSSLTVRKFGGSRRM